MHKYLGSLTLLVCTLHNAAAADENSPITAANYEKIKAGEGKMTEAEVIKLLGPIRHARSKGPRLLDLVWEDVTGIRADFRDGKAVDFFAEFSPHQPSKRINIDSFKRLQVGMSEDEARKVLGPETNKYGGGTDHRGGFGPFLTPIHVPLDMTICCWYRMTRITVQFTDGKVSGYLLTTIDADKAK